MHMSETALETRHACQQGQTGTDVALCILAQWSRDLVRCAAAAAVFLGYWDTLGMKYGKMVQVH